MSENLQNNKRIVKNTLFLYIRMFVLMIVTFFTSRVILNSLGVVDFGIHNIVGGFATMFVFFRSSLANVTQRELNIELGKEDLEKAKYIFRLHQSIYLIIAIMVAITAETIGLWFVSNKLVIPAERMTAALWVYHFTVVSLCITILSVVYDSVLIAREDMKIYSYAGIVEGLIKLLIAYIIIIIPFDRLTTYGFLLFILTAGLRAFYAFYCSKRYEECNFVLVWNKADAKKALSFISWNTLGSIVYIINDQGINILLNLFFGPIINAARAISYQVSGAIGNFSMNFYTSVRPQLTKSYASKDYDYLFKLFFLSSKYSVFLLWVFILPVTLCMDELLRFWLGEVPNNTSIFTKLVLSYSIINTLNIPIWSLALAIGNLKRYILIGSSVFFMVFPISYIFLKLGYPATSVFIVMIIIRSVYIIVVLNIIRSYLFFSLKTYFLKVIQPCLSVIIVSVGICWISFYNIQDDILGNIIKFTVGFAVSLGTIYIIGFNNNERKTIKNILVQIIKRHER